MAKLEYTAECLCGGKIICVFKKPTQMAPTIYRTRCKGCDSAFLFTCLKGQNEKGPYYYTEHEVEKMTQSLKDALKNKYGRPQKGAAVVNEKEVST